MHALKGEAGSGTVLRAEKYHPPFYLTQFVVYLRVSHYLSITEHKSTTEGYAYACKSVLSASLFSRRPVESTPRVQHVR